MNRNLFAFIQKPVPKPMLTKLLNVLLRTNSGKIWIKIQKHSGKHIWKFCLQNSNSGLNMLTHWGQMIYIYIHIHLTHWGREMHVCISDPTTTGSDNGLWPGQCQAIISTNAGILLIGPLGTNFSEILTEIHTFSCKKIHFEMSSAKWCLFLLSLNVLTKLDCH